MADPLPHEPVILSWWKRHSWAPATGKSLATGFATNRDLMCHLIGISTDPKDKLHVRLAHMQQLVIVKPRRKG